MFRLDSLGVSTVTFVCRWRYVVRIVFAFALCSPLPGTENCRGGVIDLRTPVTRLPLLHISYTYALTPMQMGTVPPQDLSHPENSMLCVVRDGFMR
jgi:hypothetical protein